MRKDLGIIWYTFSLIVVCYSSAIERKFDSNNEDLTRASASMNLIAKHSDDRQTDYDYDRREEKAKDESKDGDYEYHNDRTGSTSREDNDDRDRRQTPKSKPPAKENKERHNHSAAKNYGPILKASLDPMTMMMLIASILFIKII
ncbi:hypothetical protein NH340_JMT04685 [Sarcoptes scabiei]|nr:hypothetical protein NH340_JMT04685 [Sarcoptes scabiei]